MLGHGAEGGRIRLGSAAEGSEAEVEPRPPNLKATEAGVRQASRMMSQMCCCEVREMSRFRHAARIKALT